VGLPLPNQVSRHDAVSHVLQGTVGHDHPADVSIITIENIPQRTFQRVPLGNNWQLDCSLVHFLATRCESGDSVLSLIPQGLAGFTEEIR